MEATSSAPGEQEQGSKRPIGEDEGTEGKRARVDDDAEQAGTAGEKHLKRKMALRLGYVGKGYAGMQLNPGSKTIESELQRAFVDAGAMLASNAEALSKVQYVRAARTDKGVHAAGQIVSLKLLLVPDTVAAINRCLPENIRVLGMQRVIGSFHAKNGCDSRIYEYFMPTYMFMPGNANKSYQLKRAEASLPDAESTAAEPAPAAAAPASSSSSKKRSAPKDDDDEGEGVDDDDDPNAVQQRILLSRLDRTRSPAELQQEAEDRKKFRLSVEQLAKLRRILSTFTGTKNFHNYTSGKTFKDASASRYIMWFKAEDPIILDDQEWVALRVQGQSFMLHQIRKMVGMATTIMRVGGDPEAVLSKTFLPDKINIPRAPGAGLFLDEVKYDRYNNRLLKLGDPQPPLDWAEIRDVVKDFKREKIYPSILEDEHNGAFLEFVRCIDFYDSSLSYAQAKLETAPPPATIEGSDDAVA